MKKLYYRQCCKRRKAHNASLEGRCNGCKPQRINAVSPNHIDISRERQSQTPRQTGGLQEIKKALDTGGYDAGMGTRSRILRTTETDIEENRIMYVELADGTQVKFTNCGRGIEGAVFDAAAGEVSAASRKRGCDVLHVYYVPNGNDIPQFICCSQTMNREEIEEAQQKYEQQKTERDAANETLRRTLLGPDGLRFVSDRQKGNSDKQTASSDICEALGLKKPYTQNSSWGAVKEAIAAQQAAVDVTPPEGGRV